MTNISVKCPVLLSLGLVSLSVSAEEYRETERPNILFCLADDWGWPHAGAYGDNVVKTPNFDRVAANGVLFDYAYISSPSCSPSRNALITGSQFYCLGEGANLHSTLDIRYPNFMSLLEVAGYKTGHFDKCWGPGKYEAGGYESHPCGEHIEFEQFIQEISDGQPFCYWLGTTDPHRPYDGYFDVPYEDVEVPGFLPDVDSVKKDIAAYYFEVQRWDSRVGNALEVLEKTGRLENTIVVISGDHGFPFPRGKGNLYDYGARVPLAVQWPKVIKAGRRVSDFVSFADIAPTFLAAAGVTVPVQMTGTPFLQVLKSNQSGRVDPQRNFVVTGRERHAPAQAEPAMVGYPARAIRTDNWLFIMNLRSERWPAGVPDGATHPMNRFPDCDDGLAKFFIMNNRDEEKFVKYYELAFAQRPVYELYDISKDPLQMHNLAADNDYEPVLASLRNTMINYLRETEDPRFTNVIPHFDEYPYRTGYLDKEKLHKMKEKQVQDKDVVPPFK